MSYGGDTPWHIRVPEREAARSVSSFGFALLAEDKWWRSGDYGLKR